MMLMHLSSDLVGWRRISGIISRWYRSWGAARVIAIFSSIFIPCSGFSEVIQLHGQSGTYLIPVRINDTITLDFLLDTGASEVTNPRRCILDPDAHAYGQAERFSRVRKIRTR